MGDRWKTLVDTLFTCINSGTVDEKVTSQLVNPYHVFLPSQKFYRRKRLCLYWLVSRSRTRNYLAQLNILTILWKAIATAEGTGGPRRCGKNGKPRLSARSQCGSPGGAISGGERFGTFRVALSSGNFSYGRPFGAATIFKNWKHNFCPLEGGGGAVSAGAPTTTRGPHPRCCGSAASPVLPIGFGG